MESDAFNAAPRRGTYKPFYDAEPLFDVERVWIGTTNTKAMPKTKMRKVGSDTMLEFVQGFEFEELARDRFLIGSPDEVADECVRLHRETGVNHIISSMQWPGMDYRITMDAMQLLSEEVFPRVNQAV